MDIYQYQDVIPLSFSRNTGTGLSTGLTITVVVKNAQTGATLLASTSVPETVSGNGIYTYLWTHGLQVDTECIAIYTVGSTTFDEYFLITNNSGSRTS